MTNKTAILERLGQTFIGILFMTSLASGATVDAKLSIAAMEGDIEGIRVLLNQDVDINSPQGDGTTALHWAASRNDLETVNLLLAKGADVSAQTRLGKITPLFMAAKNGNSEVIQALLKSGADVTSSSTIGTTALMLAAGSGNPDAVQTLLDAGAPINAQDVHQGQTALMFAAASGRIEVVHILAENGADLDARSLVPTRRKKVVNVIAANQRKNNKPLKALALGGMTALQFATRENHMEVVRTLVESGADVNLPTASDQMTTLILAIVNGRYDIAKYLLNHGADPKPATVEGATALFTTMDVRWAPRGWYPSPRIDNEEVDYLELMELLLDHGADIDARMNGRMWMRIVGPGGGPRYIGDTAFLRAAMANDVKAMKFLLSRGANPSITTVAGENALSIAAGWGDLPARGRRFAPKMRLASVRFLVEEAGLDVNSEDKGGFTPLHGAAMVGDKEVIRYLIAKGADAAARANAIAGGGGGANMSGQVVPLGTGETVADVANGPLEKTLVFPEAIDLLIHLGSDFSDNCRAALCINKSRGKKKTR